jgi:3-oxoacyl-[acyl-carrier protein] reductase
VVTDLAGQAALVTGAGSAQGIGFACARQLLQHGARVALVSTTDRIHQRATELGVETVGLVADLTDSSQADGAVAGALERFGRLDIVVNNAGMTSVGTAEEGEPLISLSDEEWRRSLDRNLTTAFLVTRAAMPHLLMQGYGRVVMVGSVTGPVVALAGSGPYGAGKAGMVGLARGWALEVARQGVTVNVVAPGWVATASSTEEELAAGTATPVGRSASADEIAAAVTFLASPEASYITGAVLVVDGGNTIVEDKGTVGPGSD